MEVRWKSQIEFSQEDERKPNPKGRFENVTSQTQQRTKSTKPVNQRDDGDRQEWLPTHVRWPDPPPTAPPPAAAPRPAAATARAGCPAPPGTPLALRKDDEGQAFDAVLFVMARRKTFRNWPLGIQSLANHNLMKGRKRSAHRSSRTCTPPTPSASPPPSQPPHSHSPRL